MAHNYYSSAFLLVAVLFVQLSPWSSAANIYGGTASFTDAPYQSSCTDGPATDYYTFAAVPSSFYRNGWACGRSYSISCVGKGCLPNVQPITVTVADLCTEDKPTEPCTTFVLSKEAFITLANPETGNIGIHYQL
ncbi:EG45-like domain containing protein 2 [Linum grandiflorum]